MLAKSPPSTLADRASSSSIAPAYMAPSMPMLRACCAPDRNALNSTVGMGKRPCDAWRLATKKPSVTAGISANPSTLPIQGITLSSDTRATNIKNRPVNAKGWRKNVRKPSLTQVAPSRAGTMTSFIGG